MSAIPFVEMAVVDLSTVKTCSCGREFDRSSWDIAPLVGYAPSEFDTHALELRQCSCGSTISIAVPKSLADPSDLERFEAQMSPEPNTGCFIWTGRMTEPGYGSFCMPGSGGYAHRAALLLFVGPAPVGKPNALHSCDNRWCVNPAHLRWGTQGENIREAVERGRHRPSMLGGEEHPMSKLTWAEADEIRSLRRSGVALRPLAERFNVNISTISLIGRGKIWREDRSPNPRSCGSTLSMLIPNGEVES